MTKVKLPMPAGLILERCAAGGLKGAALADALRYQNRQAFRDAGIMDESIDFMMEFSEKNKEVCESAILNGYEFKFLSIRGLQNFLIARLGIEEGKDFAFYETFLDNVPIPAERFQNVKETVPRTWVFIETEQSGIYRIEHVSAGASTVSKS